MSALTDDLSLALAYHQASRLSQAEQIYQRVLATHPTCAEAWYLAGLLAHQLGQSHIALDYLQRAATLDASRDIFHSSQALIYRQLGRWEQAAASYRRAVQLNPTDAESHFYLGLVLDQVGQLEAAAVSFDRAVQIQPHLVEAHYNRGVVLEKLDRLDEAAACYQRTLQQQPGHAQAYHNLGNLYRKAGLLDQAVTCYLKSLQLQPNQPIACYNVGNVFLEQGHIAEAQKYLHQAVTLAPEKTLWQLKYDQICPGIMPDCAAIEQWRQQFEAALDRYPAGGLDLNHYLRDLIPANLYPPFELPYHGQNDLSLKVKYAQLFSAGAAKTVQGCRREGEPFRLGFVVTRNHEGIFYSLMRGLINNLTSPEFSVTIICSVAGMERLRSGITNPKVAYRLLPDDLEQAIQQLKTANLDLIFYWEAGSDAMNYFLPFFRLAPVQCSWGISVTTGIPQMDYFISSELFEAPGAEAHYSEQLVKFKTLPIYFYRPAVPSPLKPRGHFGLPDTAHLYLCPQNLLKFHPDFDPILGEILRRDAAGRLVLLQSRIPRLNEDLQSRFRRTIPDVAERIYWLPPLDFTDFMNLIALSEVILDPIHYSGGNTTHEALATGTPVVTLPSPFLRGRLTLGRYLKMGVLDCVAHSPAEYIDKAVQLGTDPDYRDTVRAKILAANHVLYEDMAAVHEFEQFFRQAIATVRRAN
ncbi:MAG: tetratricopeptide repeat protein [Anaerolineae bacterium]